ncbi:hypothetical protein B9Z19DRAFT_1091068 [Tuber borchii]|uniref:Uncharacterized protein n=1 Tax=Tuber borchii TaxID=42251 RepID=A0A2T6ZI26_TUBBO|nr:hypothetical protein B9Z19DRAFT_1091068 [Tuber borchii]
MYQLPYPTSTSTQVHEYPYSADLRVRLHIYPGDLAPSFPCSSIRWSGCTREKGKVLG